MEKIKVLIVEDDLKILEINKMFVEKVNGFEVVGLADNIEDGRKMFGILKPDLVILDLFFPEGYGMELAYEIRLKHKKTDIILITAAQEIESLRNALRAGIFDYIIKPVIFQRFEEALLRYKEFREKLKNEKIIEQEFVDSFFVKNINSVDYAESIPKGIDSVTLKKIKEFFLSSENRGLSAIEVGKAIGTSRSTARRYLEYLVSINFLYTDHDYGTVGRPVRKYFKRK